MRKSKKSTGLKTSVGNPPKPRIVGFYLMSEEEKQNWQLPEHKYPLSGKKFRGYGNNPSPLNVKGEVCDECNINVVIPLRIRELHSKRRG